MLVMVNQPLGDTGNLWGARHKLKCQDTYSFVSKYFLSCELMISHSPHGSVMNINIFLNYSTLSAGNGGNTCVKEGGS